MDEDVVKSNLNTVKEMILDEERLVTYVSLSKELCIHVNHSKQLLSKFVEETRNIQPNLVLNVNLIISGLAQDSKARTTVSSEKDITEVRKGLKVVFFEHIYSVSKGLSNVDNVALLAVNRFEDFPLCIGLIKSGSCIKRSSDEIGALKSSSQVSIPERKPVNPLQKKIKEETQNASNKTANAVSKPHGTKSEPAVKTEVVSPKKDMLGSSSASSAKSKLDVKKNGVRSQKGIAGFFSKSNSAPNKMISKETTTSIVKEEPIVKKEIESPKEAKREDKMDVDEEIPQPQKIKKEKDSQPITKVEQVNGKAKKSNAKLTQIKKNAKVDKKRKRVLHVSDSESDGEKDPFVDEPDLQEQNNMSDDEIPPTPTVNTVKITSGIINPKKRRKIVDKTYTDEDGYILTKKEEVYESCSDDEEVTSVKENIKVPPPNLVKQEKHETSPKKTTPKNSKKKISPPQKGKQATLMSFFKKV